MKSIFGRIGILGMIIVLMVGCGQESSRGPTSDTTSSTDTTAKAVKAESDTLPLLPIMINLERNMTTIQAGIWRENYGQIRRGAEGIGHHAKIPKSQVKTIKSILGPEAFKKFVKDDKTVHRTSLELAEAAKEKNFKKVTNLYGELYRGCVSCHLNHRREIRNSPKW